MDSEGKDRAHSEIGYVIREVSLAFKKHMDCVIGKKQDSKVTPLHAWIMRFIIDRSQHGQDTFQRDVEHEFSIRRSTATELVKLIEANGMLVREAVASDARLKRLVPTSLAKEMHKKIIVEHKNMETKMREGISEEDLAVFFKTANIIKENLEKL